MCGLLFVKSPGNKFSRNNVGKALDLQAWRGPDAQMLEKVADAVYMGHVRLSIIDPSERANQPLKSKDKRYSIIYNGEIYNHLELRQKYNLDCETGSDTETILQGFLKIGYRIFTELTGMFSIIIHDNLADQTWVCRDRYGIKPLYCYSWRSTIIYSSECVSINHLISSEIDYESVNEWRVIRRPALGYTFFKKISEVRPGVVFCNSEIVDVLPRFQKSSKEFDQHVVERLLTSSVNYHELSDVANVALLSGGIDSSLICALSGCNNLYSVGSDENNEFDGAQETANKLGRNLTNVKITNYELREIWKKLIKLKGEPLFLPNEALIYKVCISMHENEKVVLTGEGADEIFFGYDRIFRYCSNIYELNLDTFLENYGYSREIKCTERLRVQLENFKSQKSPIEFCEDFFYLYHLPTLLRRMDFASMAASKEARVPFVVHSLIEYMYRQSTSVKIDENNSKLPLRKMLLNLGLQSVLARRKIGFSASTRGEDRMSEYTKFQQFNLEVLGW